MNTKVLAEWAEIVGGIVVVVSLFYVGYQVKQNTEAIEVETLNAVVTGLNSVFDIPMDRDLAALMVRARQDPDSFDAVDDEQFLGIWAKQIATYEAAWLHKESGLLSVEYWQTLMPHQCYLLGSVIATRLWFEWQAALTTGFWEEVTGFCALSGAE